MKTTILGGILFLAPLVIVGFILGKAFQISIQVAEPLSAFMTLDGLMAVIVVNLLAVALILLFCFLAGLLAQRAFLSSKVQRLEGFLIDLIPGYAIFRSMVKSASSSEDVENLMKPVLVRFDDYDQIALEIEENEDHSVLFLPGTPSAWSGSSAIVATERITYLQMPAHQALKFMRVFGRGSLVARSQALAAKDAAE